MPTYNCAQWLDGCMESLLAQDFTDWRVIARDDASRDGSGDKLANWADRLGPRMIVLEDSGACNLGLIGNYNAVLSAAAAPYVMSADPDDSWLPGKITRTLQAMREAEEQFGWETPLAICTDAEVIDTDGQPIAPSFWRWSRVDSRMMERLSRVAIESAALGSTMMLNRALLDRALPIERGAAYQDWWLALVAVAFGRLVALPDSTILYRRHSANATGNPYSESLADAVRRTVSRPGAPRSRLESLIKKAAAQARSFVARYRGSLKPADIAALEALGDLPNLGSLRRKLAVIRHSLWFGSSLKNVGLVVLL